MLRVFKEAQKYNKNEATVSFYVHTDKMTQSNYIVDSNTKYMIHDYMILWLKALNYNKFEITPWIMDLQIRQQFNLLWSSGTSN